VNINRFKVFISRFRNKHFVEGVKLDLSRASSRHKIKFFPKRFYEKHFVEDFKLLLSRAIRRHFKNAITPRFITFLVRSFGKCNTVKGT